VAQVFYRLNIIEAFGTGIPRIFSVYENSPAKPETPAVDGGFLIRIPNMNYVLQEHSGDISLRSNEEKIIAVFSGSSFSKEDAAEALAISVSGAYKLLRRMSEKGLLSARKSGKQWVYSANLNGHK
jgi:ATP-dependent DNA helicase RecG